MSCPNTGHKRPEGDNFYKQLECVSENFVKQSKTPVVVKFSNDMNVKQVPQILDALFEAGYHGVNFGNTSVLYEKRMESISPAERKLAEYFIDSFGGGWSGRQVKDDSLLLCSDAVNHLRAGAPSQEFHVVRTGGIGNAQDVKESLDAGISLCQWYTGYFDAFAKHGHKVYRRICKDLLRLVDPINHRKLIRVHQHGDKTICQYDPQRTPS